MTHEVHDISALWTAIVNNNGTVPTDNLKNVKKALKCPSSIEERSDVDSETLKTQAMIDNPFPGKLTWLDF